MALRGRVRAGKIVDDVGIGFVQFAAGQAIALFGDGQRDHGQVRIHEGFEEAVDAIALGMGRLEDRADDAGVVDRVGVFEHRVIKVVGLEQAETVGVEFKVGDDHAPATVRMLGQIVLVIAHPMRAREGAEAEMQQARLELAAIVGRLLDTFGKLGEIEVGHVELLESVCWLRIGSAASAIRIDHQQPQDRGRAPERLGVSLFPPRGRFAPETTFR